ncbi:MAG: PHB depolymerase family esterase [Prochlorococcaceae cyanobacterium]
MRVGLLLLTAALAWQATATIAASAPAQGAWTDSSILIGGLRRWYRIYRPAHLPKGAATVVLLHGGTQSMRKIFNSRAGGTRAWLEIADRHGVLLLVPNGVNPATGDTAGDRQHWNDLRPSGSDRHADADDVRFITALVDQVGKTQGTDPRRVYLTGASNGGMMTYRLLIEAPGRFAAAATFIAALPLDSALLSPPKRPTPLLIANGTEDPLVRWEGGRTAGRPGLLRGAEATLDWWIRANRADRKHPVQRSLSDTDPRDGCRLLVTTYRALPGGAPVQFVTMAGGGHAMPSREHRLPDTRLVRRLIGPVCRDAEGADMAWDFLSKFPGPL